VENEHDSKIEKEDFSTVWSPESREFRKREI
jgi:hypothetical protein